MIQKLNYHKIWLGNRLPFSYHSFRKRLALQGKALIIIAVFFLAPIHVLSQDRCSIIEYQNIKEQEGHQLEPSDQFENWLLEKKSEALTRAGAEFLKTNATIYKIPVVVHVIHNGEPIGFGANISTAQIQSQIDVLNEDFRRLNTDASQTPFEFLGVAADPEIEFALAKQDPDGLATTGIVRTIGPQQSYSTQDDDLLKSLSYWPAEDYLNIWVAPLSAGVLGYASFPVSSLEGITQPNYNRLTDGVVIGYNYFGSIEKDPTAQLKANYNLGRTATHEIGHFLGLRHIWGDGDCSVDDFCADTPDQSGATSGCPSSRATCGSNDMFQNFMDYTYDGCMNIFTLCQKGRMRIVLENSPRRLSLLTSHALNDPVPRVLDLGIEQIITPAAGECSLTITPSIMVKNFGSDQVTSATITLTVQTQVVETKNFALNLGNLNTQILQFSNVMASTNGYIDFKYQIIDVNGVQDDYTKNDTLGITTYIPEIISLPALEAFDQIPSTWENRNPDNGLTWELSNAPNLASNNTALEINFFNYSGAIGQEDYFITPKFDLSNATSPYLSFDIAYAQYPGVNLDGLKIAVSTDCSSTFPDIIYNKKSAELKTTNSTSLPFSPSSQSDWRKEIIDLSAYIGQPEVQVAFISVNGYGNNLYIDNVKLTKSPIYDISITQLSNPPEITCENLPTPTLALLNSGIENITDLHIDVTNNGNLVDSKDFNSLSISTGQQIILPLDAITLGTGNNALTFLVTLTGGVTDFNTKDNSLSENVTLITDQEFIPLREYFQNNSAPDPGWNISSQPDGNSWQILSADGNGIMNKAASVKAYGSNTIGSRTMLISPILDFTYARNASVLFRMSYASKDDKPDILRVKASTDCGQTFPFILYEKAGAGLAIKSSVTEWFPSSANDWVREYIDLSDFAGNQDVILAFEFVDGGGNNLYLDDIEFFTENNPDPVSINQYFLVYPNPSFDGKFNVTFNFDQKMPTLVIIMDHTGREMYRTEVTNTLNQTIPIDLSQKPAGIYLVRVINNLINQTHRIALY